MAVCLVGLPRLVKICGLEKLDVRFRSFKFVPNVIEYAQHLGPKMVAGGGKAGMKIPRPEEVRYSIHMFS